MQRRGWVSIFAIVTVMTAVTATSSVAETLLERGTYLVEGIAACGTCHARPGQESADIKGDLAGGIPFRIRGRAAYAANITPHPETGIGGWSDTDIVRAIRQGRRPDGTRIVAMPIELYRQISDRDALAIATYLRSLKPVENDVPRTVRGTVRPRPSARPSTRSVAEPNRDDPVAYGAYLAGPLGRCIECHTPTEENGDNPDYKNMLGAGGVTFTGPWGQSISGNITPDKDTGIGELDDDQIKAMIIHGVRPNRTRVGRPMAHTYYREITDRDLDAIVAYLQSLKPIKNFIDK